MNRPTRILVVEDDDALRYAVSRLLKLPGYQVLEASSGEECLRIAQKERPDLVLLDVRLPDMSGVEVCRRIRATPEIASIFIVHVTGVETSPDSQADALDAGADGYLTKPIHDRALLATIRAMIRIRSAERALVEQQRLELHALNQPAGGEAVLSPLSTESPPTFDALVKQQETLLLQAATREKGAPRPGTERLRVLADQLAALKLGARDIIEIHTTALGRCVNGADLATTQALIEEGRLLALELMGLVLSRYRAQLR